MPKGALQRPVSKRQNLETPLGLKDFAVKSPIWPDIRSLAVAAPPESDCRARKPLQRRWNNADLGASC